jgi:hypothetical protein
MRMQKFKAICERRSPYGKALRSVFVDLRWAKDLRRIARYYLPITAGLADDTAAVKQFVRHAVLEDARDRFNTDVVGIEFEWREAGALWAVRLQPAEIKTCPFCINGGEPVQSDNLEEIGCQRCGAIAPLNAWQERPSGGQG